MIIHIICFIVITGIISLSLYHIPSGMLNSDSHRQTWH